MRNGALLLLIVSAAAAGCGGNSSGKLERQLKTGVARAYGPVESVSCSKSGGRRLPTGEALNDCTIRFASGKVVHWCAVLARGVAAWDRKPCARSSLARR